MPYIIKSQMGCPWGLAKRAYRRSACAEEGLRRTCCSPTRLGKEGLSLPEARASRRGAEASSVAVIALAVIATEKIVGRPFPLSRVTFQRWRPVCGGRNGSPTGACGTRCQAPERRAWSAANIKKHWPRFAPVDCLSASAMFRRKSLLKVSPRACVRFLFLAAARLSIRSVSRYESRRAAYLHHVPTLCVDQPQSALLDEAAHLRARSSG